MAVFFGTNPPSDVHLLSELVRRCKQAEPLFSFGSRFKTSLLDHATIVIRSFLEHFLAVEHHYPDDKSELLGAYKLATAHEDNPAAALQGVLSHFNIERKVTIVLTVLDFCSAIDSRLDTHVSETSVLPVLKELARLESTKHVRVQRKAKQISATFQSNIVEENKALVLPALRELAVGLTEDQVSAEMTSTKQCTGRDVRALECRAGACRCGGHGA